MIVRLVLSLVLAFAPAAQAQVGSRRAVSAPLRGLSLPGTSPIPRITPPSHLTTAILAPTLAPVLAAPVAAQLAPARVQAAAVQPVELFARRVLVPGTSRGAPMSVEPDDFSLRAAELRAAFDEKKPEVLDLPVADGSHRDVPAALQPAKAKDAPNASEPPAPRRGPAFSRSLVFFLVALVLAQIGIEAQTAGLPR
ncbi:MAG: hypothetical protein M0D55_15405 [Elusimicrobiota bacterium]|nr:MAG: hypothetical protein M0D55_15405 [Elusimicrobiota bacterium]